MIHVVAALTLVCLGLLVLCAGMLRSIGDLLERVGELERRPRPPGERELAAGVVAPPTGDGPVQTVSALEGVDADLAWFRRDLADFGTEYVLLAFLSTTCLTCLDIWRDMIEAGDDARAVVADDDRAAVVVVLRGREEENLGKARALAGRTVPPVVFAGALWEDLEIPGSPYFTLVRVSDRSVVGAGSAQAFDQLASLAHDAMLELALTGSDRSYAGLIASEDRELRAAGLLPGDPSLTAPLVDD